MREKMSMSVIAGLACVAVAFVTSSCETSESDDNGNNGSNGNSPYGVSQNHIIRGGYEDIQTFRWKQQTQSDVGPRVVARWPSDLYWFYRCTPENTYVMVGDVRLDYYAMDRDNYGRKLSYQKLGMVGADFPPNVKATLYRDGKPFAYVNIPDPNADISLRLPNQAGKLGDDGYRARAVSENPPISGGSIDVQGFRYKVQEEGSPNHSGDIPRGVTRWPSDLTWAHGVNSGNSYVIFGMMLMEFYQVDEDNGGAKPSFGAHPWDGADFPPDTICTLYKDGQPFASIVIPDPKAEIQAFLP